MSDYERILPGYRSMPDPDGVIAFIDRFSIWELGGSDGCPCCHFELLGFKVGVSCHKSEHCVRVYSDYMGSDWRDAERVAQAVLRWLPDGGVRYRVRYCDYAHDHVNGRWEDGAWREEQKCCYCGKPRAHKEAYLCAECLTNESAVAAYPASLPQKEI